MPIVKMPDGTQVQFPDDMPGDQIKSLILSKFPDAGQGVSANSQANDPYFTDLPVPGTFTPKPLAGSDRYRSPIPGGDALNAFGEAMGGNIPIVGPLVNRAGDELGSRIASMITGRPEEEMLAEGQGRQQALADDNQLASTAGAIAGSVGPLMALGTTQLGGKLMGLAGPWWQRMAAGAASGGALAGADAAARGDGLDDVAQKGALGFGLGAALPLAERLMSPLARMIAGRPASTHATRAVAQNIGREGLTADALMQELQRLGPDAMLLDAGPNLTRQAGAIASLPGEGQTILRDALAKRAQGTNARIQGDVNSTLGPATSPTQFNQGISDAQRALSPAYEQAFANARAVDTSPIALNLDSAAVNLRGEAQSVAKSLRDMLNVNGIDALDPNPRTLFEVRKAIDGMFGTVQDGNARRILSETRKLVDDELSRVVPGIKDADAQFAQLAQQRDAFAQGQTSLDSGRSALTPEDLRQLVAGSPGSVVDAMSQGARAEIDRIIGTTGNNLTALKSAVKGDGSWNRDRLVTLFGKGKADQLLNVLEREQRFASSFDTVTRNSETAARTAAQKEAAPREFDIRIQDLVTGIPQKVANVGARWRSEATNKAIAEMLMGRPSRDVVDQLIAARAAQRGLIGAAPVPLLTNR